MSLETFIKNLVNAANMTTSQLGTDGQAVVTDAVNLAETFVGTGDQKFSIALAKAGTDLLTLGKDVSLFALHLAIETAVTELKGSQPSAPVVDANAGAASSSATGNAAPATASSVQADASAAAAASAGAVGSNVAPLPPQALQGG